LITPLILFAILIDFHIWRRWRDIEAIAAAAAAPFIFRFRHDTYAITRWRYFKAAPSATLDIITMPPPHYARRR